MITKNKSYWMNLLKKKNRNKEKKQRNLNCLKRLKVWKKNF